MVARAHVFKMPATCSVAQVHAAVFHLHAHACNTFGCGKITTVIYTPHQHRACAHQFVGNAHCGLRRITDRTRARGLRGVNSIAHAGGYRHLGHVVNRKSFASSNVGQIKLHMATRLVKYWGKRGHGAAALELHAAGLHAQPWGQLVMQHNIKYRSGVRVAQAQGIGHKIARRGIGLGASFN